MDTNSTKGYWFINSYNKPEYRIISYKDGKGTLSKFDSQNQIKGNMYKSYEQALSNVK